MNGWPMNQDTSPAKPLNRSGKHLEYQIDSGFSIVADHGHCMLPEVQRPEVEAFIEKFLLGNETVNTKVEIHPYQEVNYEKWIQW